MEGLAEATVKQRASGDTGVMLAAGLGGQEAIGVVSRRIAC